MEVDDDYEWVQCVLVYNAELHTLCATLGSKNIPEARNIGLQPTVTHA